MQNIQNFTLLCHGVTRPRTNLGKLRISKGIFYVRMTNDNDFLTIYGHDGNLFNNKCHVYRNCLRRRHSHRSIKGEFFFSIID